MEKKTPIQLVIDFMSKKKKPVSFSEIVEMLKEKNIVSEKDFQNFIVSFYDEFSTDSNFAFLGNGMWALSSKVKYDDIPKAEYDEEDDNTELIDNADEDDAEETISAEDRQDLYNGEEVDITKSVDDEEENSDEEDY